MRPILTLALLAAASASYGKQAIPFEARAVIRKVQQAARAHDFTALEKHMTADCLWSFGGDGDARQALAAWRADRRAVRALSLATSGPCERIASGDVICPAHSGSGHRARFTATPSGWRMASFVAGD